MKADLFGGRGSLTLAAYDIERRNILTQVAIDTVSNVGRERSRGVELSGEARLTKQWAVTASSTYTDAEYGDFVDPNYGVAASGNRPPNVEVRCLAAGLDDVADDRQVHRNYQIGRRVVEDDSVAQRDAVGTLRNQAY